ncbi:hypothetical protein H6P81_002522 [Aristolochia fimbriata]|uniref:RING-type domain-containing protein n=1 Tax=Aristolochia fimbriata TaxID=158543 RepID=A0AAV7FBP0_ARIFI|nr:hypothetical protein H6P81_002522 [Aristolochia fimbriata]
MEQALQVAVASLSVEEKVIEVLEGDRKEIESMTSSGDHGFCAICLEKIPLQDTALVKGCEHAYCVTCILIWATYSQNPSCPQCKNPFQFLNVHRSLDGCIHDYMFEESVCLLLRASWFVPLQLESRGDAYEEKEDIYQYEYELEEDSDDIEESYYISNSSTLRIGNRRWGDNGYVRAGRKEARPIHQERFQELSAGGSSRGQARRRNKGKEVTEDAEANQLKGKRVTDNVKGNYGKGKEVIEEAKGRRAKRAMKREAADKAAAAKHLKHLQRMGRVPAALAETGAEVVHSPSLTSLEQ